MSYLTIINNNKVKVLISRFRMTYCNMVNCYVGTIKSFNKNIYQNAYEKCYKKQALSKYILCIEKVANFLTTQFLMISLTLIKIARLTCYSTYLPNFEFVLCLATETFFDYSDTQLESMVLYYS